MIIIGVSGKKAAGKDLLGGYLKYRGFVKESFANYLKELCRTFFNLSKEQTDGNLKEAPTKFAHEVQCDNEPTTYWTPRQILQRTGAYFRSVNPNFWVDKTIDRLKGLHNEARVVITDVRYQNEADAIKAAGGYLVRLNRKDSEREKVYPGCSADTHESEIALDTYKGFDLVLEETENENPQDIEKFTDRLMDYIEKDQQDRRARPR
jgi:hypothetical protein